MTVLPDLTGAAEPLYLFRLAERRNPGPSPLGHLSASIDGKACFVNVTLEHLAPCKKLLRVEIETKQVDETFDSITKDFQRQASLPGFRPGKAPRDMVLRKYEKDITDEVKRKLISDSYRKALDEKKIDVVGYPDIEEIQFGRGQTLQFAATVETAPEFELPDYKGLAVKKENRSVSD